jgi:hypothetical protein
VRASSSSQLYVVQCMPLGLTQRLGLRVGALGFLGRMSAVATVLIGVARRHAIVDASSCSVK